MIDSLLIRSDYQMSKLIFEEHVSKDDLNMTQYIELVEKEKALQGIVALLFITGFLLFISSVALALWFNKLTLFIWLIIAFPTAVFTFTYFKWIKKYTSLVKSYKKE